MKLSVAALLATIPICLAGCATGQPATSSTVIIQDGDTVAFLGDSITASGANYGNYCRLVVQGLKARDVRAKPVLAGIPGNTSKDMLDRLDKDVLAHNPNWVVLAVGVNDIWHGDPTVKIGVFQPKPGMGVKLPEYKKNVTAIVDRCTKAGARVLLTTITPIREDPEFKLNIIAREYNAFLYQMAAERELPIATLHEDMFAEIAQGTRLTSDGVHPIAAGHRIMAKGILRAMGVGEQEANAMEDEWLASAHMLLLGDRQTTSGTRTGGWCHLVLDGLNSDREMVTLRMAASYRGAVTVASLIKSLKERITGAPRYVVLQAPIGDIQGSTRLRDYEKQVEQLIELVVKASARPVIVTIPVRDNDPASELSRQIIPYNDVLRRVAKTKGIAVADIWAVMKSHYDDAPETHLTFDGERFNREGSYLMAEALLNAMGLDARITPALRQTWNKRSSYTDKYKRK